ncbi:MAG: glycosyltransferase family 2 protein [Candidatus Acidiferrum sp.]
MPLAFKIVLWTCICAVVYNYAGYPILLFILASISQAFSDLGFFLSRQSRRAPAGSAYQPRVAIILSVFNEEAVIQDRIENVLSLRYPEHLTEILVGLDSPTDSTADILRELGAPRTKLFCFNERRGKLGVISELAQHTSSDILIFTDANTHFEPDCVANLVRHFQNPRVGVVSGEEVRTSGRNIDPAAEGIYWKYESALKILESRLGLLHSANGGVYAIRRELFHPEANLIVEDFQIPLSVRFKNYFVVYDPEAIAIEEIAPTLSSQVERRIRIGAGNWQTLFQYPRYLNPLHGRPSFAYWSHRVLRWLTPFLLILAYGLSAGLLRDMPYRVLFGLQTVFYLFALIGYWRKKRNQSPGICNIPLYFVTMNTTILLGFIRYASGRQSMAWKATPRTQNSRVE